MLLSHGSSPRVQQPRLCGFFAYVGKYWSSALFPLCCKGLVALETFDMKTRVEVDFTQNKDEVMQG